MLVAEFNYFKTSGKWYTEGKGQIPTEQFRGLSRQDILDANGGEMPGISGDAAEFFVVVVPLEGVPVLLVPNSMKGIVYGV